jgi:hypothetical protein
MNGTSIMTRMMIKILNQAIDAIAQGEQGHEIERGHYEGYRGMKKIVDRLVAKELVQLCDVAGTGKMFLVPTPQGYDAVQSQTSDTSVLRAA